MPASWPSIPPRDVRLNLLPLGGYDDYHGMLHESGHAQHFAHMDPQLPVIYRYWGDRGFTEGMAYLFQHLAASPSWLKEMVGLDNPEELLWINDIEDMVHTRRLASQFLYQLELFETRKLDGMARRYRTIMERGMGVRVDSSGHLSFDMEFYSAGYVRARIFERKLRAHLEQRFGIDWWRQRETSDFLVQFYAQGRRLRAEEVLDQIGSPGIDPIWYFKAIAG